MAKQCKVAAKKENFKLRQQPSGGEIAKNEWSLVIFQVAIFQS